ncbi:MAG TPA: TonB-dependent receptor [Caulobacteraceae bacterium]
MTHNAAKRPLWTPAVALLAGVSSLALAAAPATAATADAAATATAVPEIIVTAQKREEAINKVPMSISAVSGPQLLRQGIVRLSDLPRVVPGLSYTQSVVGTPIYTLRGVGFVDISMGGRPTVTVYSDQAPIPFTIETTGGNLDLERIEVLKGPQGTLFGENATGGAINLVAAKPTRTFEAGAEASYGNYNAWSLGGYVSGPVSDTLGIRLAARHDGGDGWQKSTTTPGLTNGATDLTTARLIVDWRPTSRLKIELNVNGFIDRSDSQAVQLIQVEPTSVPLIPALATFPIAPPNDTAADWNPDESYRRDNRFFQANLRGDYELPGGFTLTSLTSYSHYKEFQNVDTDGTPLSGLQQLTVGKISSWYEEARISGRIGDRANVVFGGDYSSDRVAETNYDDLSGSTQAFTFSSFGLPLFKTFRDIDNQNSHSYAVFGNVDYNLTNTLKLNAGVRYTRAIDHFTGCSADTGDGNAAADFGPFENIIRVGVLGLPPNPPILPGACVSASPTFVPTMVVSTLDEDNVSWRAGLDWQLDPRVMLYANVSRGFKAGGYPDLGATSTTQFDPARQEAVTAYEAGFKAGLGPTVQLNGAAFYYDYSDKQVLGSVSDPLFVRLLKLINIPKSRIIGAELEATWIPTPGLTLTGNASYIDSEILDNFTNFNIFGAQQNFGGEPFPNTPKWTLTGGASYHHPVSEGLDGFADVNVSYRSATNTALGEIPLVAIGSYALVDVDLGVESQDGAWRASIWARNLGDTYYWTGAYLNIDTAVRSTGMPRTFGVRLEYRFRGG